MVWEGRSREAPPYPNYQVRGREQKTGQRSSFPMGGHRRSRIAAMESVLRAWIEQAPGLSLAELCERLAEQGIPIKIGALWHQLNNWKLSSILFT